MRSGAGFPPPPLPIVAPAVMAAVIAIVPAPAPRVTVPGATRPMAMVVTAVVRRIAGIFIGRVAVISGRIIIAVRIVISVIVAARDAEADVGPGIGGGRDSRCGQRGG